MWNNDTGIFDPETDLEVEGIRGFMQPRLDNGTFKYTDPRHCTVHDPLHATCYMDGSNLDGFYEGGPIVVRTNNSGMRSERYMHAHIVLCSIHSTCHTIPRV